jgi:hypothetical protein
VGERGGCFFDETATEVRYSLDRTVRGLGCAIIAVLSADERLFCASGMLDGEIGGCLAASVWEKTALPLSMYRKRRRNTALIPYKAAQDQPQNTVGHDSAV